MVRSEEDFKWFGEGFDGFPKILPDDCVEYCIYFIDSSLKDHEVRDKLREVQIAAKKLTRSLLGDFIWQRDAFDLTLERDRHRSYLRGRTNFGDSPDDEWTIVYLLRQLSKQYPDAWVRVFDTDGEFLLIESANALPIWLNPEVADFRVWIHDGKLLVIPLENPGGGIRGVTDPSDRLTLERAIEWIGSPDRKVQHPAKVEAEAFVRLGKYPQQIQDSMHQALVRVPRRLAYTLHEMPRAVSPAIEAFYLRDPISLRVLQEDRSKDLRFGPQDLVVASVKFTKAGYAQLRGQQFALPQAWDRLAEHAVDSRAGIQLEVGAKLSCGFEMLVSNTGNEDKPVVRELNLLLEDLESGEVLLPSDEEVKQWGSKDDPDSWLDINFKDFEKELDGQGEKNSVSVFGNEGTHDNLSRTVQRFQDFLKSEEATPEGGLIDDMDLDDGTSSEASASSDDGDVADDKPKPTDEDDFTAMMRELMGMPKEVMNELMSNPDLVPSQQHDLKAAFQQRTSSSTAPLEIEGMDNGREIMEETEKELRDAGVLES